MNRASALAERLRLRRRQMTGDAARHPRHGGTREARPERPPGSLTPQAQRQLDAALREGAQRAAARKRSEGERSVLDDLATQPEQDFPYPGTASPDQAVAVMLSGADAEEMLLAPRPMPSFTPEAAGLRRTAPVPVLREQPPADPARTMLQRLESGLRELDWEALDEAQRQGKTYAQAHAARGRTPLGDKAERNFRPEVRPVRRHGEAAERKVRELKYPKPDVTVPVSVTAAAYDALLRHVDAITGTRGIGPGRPPLPAITAGGAA